MKMPDVASTIIDQERDVTYRVFAYRSLTHAELVLAVRHFHAQKKRKKLKRGETVIIHSIIGHDGQ